MRKYNNLFYYASFFITNNMLYLYSTKTNNKMSTETQKVFFKNVTLEITGDYYRGEHGTWESMPEESEFEIETILLKGVDVTQLLDDYINDLEILTIETIEN